MKTIEMSRDYSFRAGPRVFVQFKAGVTYQRVTETQARAIIDAGAGRDVAQTLPLAPQMFQSE